VIDEHHHPLIVTEQAGRGQHAHVQRIEVLDIDQIKDQPRRPDMPNDLHQRVPQLRGDVGVDVAVRPDDDGAIRLGSDIDPLGRHRLTFRYPELSES